MPNHICLKCVSQMKQIFHFRNQCLESDVVLRYGNIIKPSKLEEIYIKPDVENFTLPFKVDDDDDDDSNHYDDGNNDYSTDIFDDVKTEIVVSPPKKKQRKKITVIKVIKSKIKKPVKKIESVEGFQENNAGDNILKDDNLVLETNEHVSKNDEKEEFKVKDENNTIEQKECNELQQTKINEGKFKKSISPISNASAFNFSFKTYESYIVIAFLFSKCDHFIEMKCP